MAGLRGWFAAAAAVLVLLAFLAERPAYAGPPERVSSRLVLDPVPELRAAVRRLEQESAAVATDPGKVERLTEARALLAEAEGRLAAAVKAWRKVIAFRRDTYNRMRQCVVSDNLLLPRRGKLAQAQCRLAEIEHDLSVLAAELPRVIAGYEEELTWLGEPEPTDARISVEVQERDLLTKLRNARARLEAVRRTLEPP
jgi:hypothetical protein